MKEQIVQLSDNVYNELKEKAEKWDLYQAGLKHKADHLNKISKAERVKRAKKAVEAREAKKHEDLRKGCY